MDLLIYVQGGRKDSMDKVKKALLTEEENGNRENGEVQR